MNKFGPSIIGEAIEDFVFNERLQAWCGRVRIYSGTYSEVETLPPVERIKETLDKVEKALEAEPKADDKETEEELRKRARKPPSEGPCKMCKLVKPLNRLLLCYGCWLKDKLHKDSGCDAPGGCATKNQGN